MNLSDAMKKLLAGDPFGQVFPPRPDPPRSADDGRTVALKTLRKYIAELMFFRKGDTGGPPIGFKIAEKNIHIEQPDNVADLVFPSIGFIPGRGTYDSIGLTSFIEEASRDVYAPGTVLQWQSEYTETVVLEVWAAKKAERRAMIAGLEVALVPTEQWYGLRFRMPDYYGQLACFTLMGRTLVDDAESAKNRRRARIELELRYTVVALVNYVTLTPLIVTDVKDGTDAFDPDITVPLDTDDA